MKRGRVFERVTLGGVVVAAGLLVAQSPSGSIQGTVKSEEGMPIRCLLLVSNGMFRESVGNVVERRAFTAADGSFTVPSLPAGNYDLRSGASGIHPAIGRSFCRFMPLGRTSSFGPSGERPDDARGGSRVAARRSLVLQAQTIDVTGNLLADGGSGGAGGIGKLTGFAGAGQ